MVKLLVSYFKMKKKQYVLKSYYKFYKTCILVTIRMAKQETKLVKRLRKVIQEI